MPDASINTRLLETVARRCPDTHLCEAAGQRRREPLGITASPSNRITEYHQPKPASSSINPLNITGSFRRRVLCLVATVALIELEASLVATVALIELEASLLCWLLTETVTWLRDPPINLISLGAERGLSRAQ